MIRRLKEMLLLNILLVPPMVFFPAICLTLAAYPDPLAAQLCFWFGPLSAGFWVLVCSQWSSAHAWNKMGRLRQWHEDHGGFLCTIPRACGWLLFASSARFYARSPSRSCACWAASTGSGWMALFPFAAYFPLVPTWFWRRRRV